MKSRNDWPMIHRIIELSQFEIFSVCNLIEMEVVFFLANEKEGEITANQAQDKREISSISATKKGTCNSGNAIGTAGAIAPPPKEESILVGRTLTMESILCLIKAS